MKIYIYNEMILKNIGGPSGYLYNLKFFLKETNKVHFLNEDEIDNNKIQNKTLVKLKKRLKDINFISKKVLLKNINKIKEDKIKEEYKIVHFHTTLSYFQLRKSMKDKIKVLTSHSPQPSYEELLELHNLDKNKLKPQFIDSIKKIDTYSFKDANYIIFPCKEAMEPYLNRDEEIRDILVSKLEDKKIKFLPTGIVDKKIEFQAEYFYKKFGIPKDALVLCYLGRHNEIKGYDLLVEAGKKILEKHKDVYIIVGGQINPNIKPLNHERWIELGWTTEGDNIMKHAHAYLLPNRETYFDLVFIEALRAGTTIICSETGGNKYFKNFNSSEIIYFEKENIENIAEVVEKNLKVFRSKDYVLNRKENRKLYENNFTSEKFGNNYINIMEEIYEENKKFKK